MLLGDEGGENNRSGRHRLLFQGLTKTYNALEEPSCDDRRILVLRRMHEDMDRAVLAAYSWSDIVVPPFCPMSEADRAALQAFEDEVIDRLYVLNAERAREEERLGLGAKRGNDRGATSDGAAEAATPKVGRGEKKKRASRKGQGDLF